LHAVDFGLWDISRVLAHFLPFFWTSLEGACSREKEEAAAILRKFRRFSQIIITLKYHNLAVSLDAGNETFIVNIGADVTMQPSMSL